MAELEGKIIARAPAPRKKIIEGEDLELVKPIPQYVEWVLFMTGLIIMTGTFLFMWLGVL